MILTQDLEDEIYDNEDIRYKQKIEETFEEYEPEECCKQSTIESEIFPMDEIPVYEIPQKLASLELDVVDKCLNVLKEGAERIKT